jgi:dihydrofolate reductase
MRKVIVEAEVSIDGAMGGENADFWQHVFPFHSADVLEYLDDLLFTPDALLLGQKTYRSSPRSGRPDKGNRQTE